MSVVKFKRKRLPTSEAAPCLDKLAGHAHAGVVRGVAFVCLLDDGYIADTCGTASDHPDQVRLLLKALDAKIAKRQLRERRN